MSLDMRFAGNGDYGRISAFLDEFWSRNHVYCREEPLFRWTFGRHTHWPPDQFSVALAEDQGQIAGMLGGIPFTFNCRGTTHPAVWIVNYVIRPDHRRGPAALQLLSMFRKPEFQPVVAFGINPSTSVIYRVLRGDVLSEIPRHFCVMPGCAEDMARILTAAWPDWSHQRALELANDFELPRLSGSAEFGEHIPEDWDRRDWPEIAHRTAGAARDRQYLKWRYEEHPSFHYHFLTVPDGGRTGLAVWRREVAHRLSDGERVPVGTIARLLEFIPASQDNAQALLSVFLRRAREAGAVAADYYDFHGPTRCLLEQSGFRATARHPAGNSLPSRFQPLDGKGGGILSAMFSEPGTPHCTPDNGCIWYWTKSDSDQDRPN